MSVIDVLPLPPTIRNLGLSFLLAELVFVSDVFHLDGSCQDLELPEQTSRWSKGPITGLRHSRACDNIDRRPMLTVVFLSVHRDRRSDDGGKC